MIDFDDEKDDESDFSQLVDAFHYFSDYATRVLRFEALGRLRKREIPPGASYDRKRS